MTVQFTVQCGTVSQHIVAKVAGVTCNCVVGIDGVVVSSLATWEEGAWAVAVGLGGPKGSERVSRQSRCLAILHGVGMILLLRYDRFMSGLGFRLRFY